MKVFLGQPRGFCAGVVRAIDVVQLALDKLGPPIYVKHQIVHNQYVVEALENKGAKTVQDVDEIPPGSNVVFSAHGSPPEDFQKAELRGLKVIDATCPLVTKVHNEARRYSDDGRNLILVGHRGHQEVRSTMGQRPYIHLVDDREELDLPDWHPNTPVTVLTQTTLSVDDTEKSIDEIKSRFSDVVVRNDLCYATTNRQFVVKELCQLVDLVLVVGSSNSSNCNRLREVAQSLGVTAYLINDPEEFDRSWLEGIEDIGITSGASTPDQLVDAIIDAVCPDEVITIQGAEEDVTFTLPQELRGQAQVADA